MDDAAGVAVVFDEDDEDEVKGTPLETSFFCQVCCVFVLETDDDRSKGGDYMHELGEDDEDDDDDEGGKMDDDRQGLEVGRFQCILAFCFRAQFCCLQG